MSKWNDTIHNVLEDESTFSENGVITSEEDKCSLLIHKYLRLSI